MLTAESSLHNKLNYKFLVVSFANVAQPCSDTIDYGFDKAIN